MYSRVNWEKFLQHVQTLLSEKPKTLSETFIAFWNPCKIWLILINRISFIALIFCRLLALRNVVTWMPESFCFRTPLDSQRVQESETLLKSTPKHFYPKLSLIQEKLSEKISLFVRSEILAVFGKRLTADHMYSCHNWDKFSQHVQTSLSSKIENIFQNFDCIFGIYMKFCAS